MPGAGSPFCAIIAKQSLPWIASRSTSGSLRSAEISSGERPQVERWIAPDSGEEMFDLVSRQFDEPCEQAEELRIWEVFCKAATERAYALPPITVEEKYFGHRIDEGRRTNACDSASGRPTPSTAHRFMREIEKLSQIALIAFGSYIAMQAACPQLQESSILSRAPSQ